MKTVITFGFVCVALMGCGVKGDLVRESGAEPPSISTPGIQNATTGPRFPSTWLF